MKNIEIAMNILTILLKDGQLDRENNQDLFMYYEGEVLDILTTVEEKFDVTIKKIGNTIYLIPSATNELMGFKNKDFRNIFGSQATNIDAFLSYYIIMYMLYKFYGSKNKNPKQIDFLPINLLIEDLDKRFLEVLEAESDIAEVIEEELDINLISIAKLWTNKITFDANKKKTKYGVIQSIIRFLEEQKLMYIVEEQIRTTKKLDDLMTFYFLSTDRLEEINLFMDKGVKEYAKDK